MERRADILYVEHVIKPLEELIHRIESTEELSSEGLERLNQLLVEKYIALEKISKEVNLH